jgi:5,6-dimethylbenzimidazole synthase
MEHGDKAAAAARREDAPQFDSAFRARLYDLLKWRRDVRRFKRDPLPPGAIERLIGLAHVVKIRSA